MLNRTQPGDEPTVVGIHEQDDPNDGFLVMLTNEGGRCSVALTEPELQTLGRLIQQRFGDQDPLIGQFFHTHEDDGITRQGHVGGVIQPGHYVVTFFSWLNGEKNGTEIVKFTDMIDQGWVFHDDEEQWRSIGDEYMKRKRGEREANPFLT